MYYAVTVLYCTIIKYLLSCNAGAIIFQPKRHSFCNLLKIEIDVNWGGGVDVNWGGVDVNWGVALFSTQLST